MLPEKASQFHAVVPIQLEVQQQELVDIRVCGQPLHKRQGGMEHVYVVVPPLGTSFSVQHTVGGCFILFCCARVIFANGDAVHSLTSGIWESSASLYHRFSTMTSHTESPILPTVYLLCATVKPCSAFHTLLSERCPFYGYHFTKSVAATGLLGSLYRIDKYHKGE